MLWVRQAKPHSRSCFVCRVGSRYFGDIAVKCALWSAIFVSEETRHSMLTHACKSLTFANFLSWWADGFLFCWIIFYPSFADWAKHVRVGWQDHCCASHQSRGSQSWLHDRSTQGVPREVKKPQGVRARHRNVNQTLQVVLMCSQVWGEGLNVQQTQFSPRWG